MKKNDKDLNVILDDERSILLDHNYDGIEELDHPLPSWWQGAFYLTIIFGVIYFVYFSLAGGPTQDQELQKDLEQIAKLAPAPSAAGDVEAKIVAALKDADVLAKGRTAFIGKCVACHGDAGQGIIGPNLADNHWIHGDGTPGAILKVVTDGVAEKGMPPWGPVLSADEMVQVVVYVASLRGTNPAGAKAPEGNEFK